MTPNQVPTNRKTCSTACASPVNGLAAWDLVHITCWVLNWILLLSLVAWLSIDGYLANIRLASWSLSSLGSMIDVSGSENSVLPDSIRKPRQAGLIAIIALACTTWIVICLGLIAGTTRWRGTRSFLHLSGNIACWLSVCLHYSSIVDQGRVARLHFAQEDVLNFSRAIDAHWDDIISGKDTDLLPFVNTYPIFKPTLLMLLGERKIPLTNLYFNAIERTCDHSLRFELTKSNKGYWLEVRHDLSEPDSFIGGLGEGYHPVYSQRISERLYVVKYESS